MNWDTFLRHSGIDLIVPGQIPREVEIVQYGSSDAVPNPGELLLLDVAVGETGSSTKELRFFIDPKAKKSEELFGISLTAEEVIAIMRSQAELLSFNEIVQNLPFADVSIEEVVRQIQRWREIQKFQVVKTRERVFTTEEVSEIGKLTLNEVVNESGMIFGGAIIYWIWGAFLATSYPQVGGVMPRKQFTDVLGAFIAGVQTGGKKAYVIPTGEIEILTKSQWEVFEEATSSKGRKTRQWLLAPPAIADLLRRSEHWLWINSRLKKQEYCPICYDPDSEEQFYLWKPQLRRFEVANL